MIWVRNNFKLGIVSWIWIVFLFLGTASTNASELTDIGTNDDINYALDVFERTDQIVPTLYEEFPLGEDASIEHLIEELRRIEQEGLYRLPKYEVGGGCFGFFKNRLKKKKGNGKKKPKEYSDGQSGHTFKVWSDSKGNVTRIEAYGPVTKGAYGQVGKTQTYVGFDTDGSDPNVICYK